MRTAWFGPTSFGRSAAGKVALFTAAALATLMAPRVAGFKLRVLNFTFANGSLLSPVTVDAPPMCPGNRSMCSFEEVINDPATASHFNKEKILRTRRTIVKLLDILESAAQATGLVRGSLFSSAFPEGTEVSPRSGFLIRKKREDVSISGGPFTSLCYERILPYEYPDIGRNERGEWRYLSGKQAVQYTYCTNEGGACSAYVILDSPHDMTKCVQKFGFAPMVVFDQKTQKFANERILVPCGCQCQYGRG
ncbi:hypothetical protein BIW11_14161 [Tropilaelaps mercedesae]|uniref:Spaetzle domain-containing protein n=1 Tax=Tropilaelaps mercedesae TaxID=418985 RepID=A0A1V9WYV2_9ACAR|nr:hypothetical protein BIW11_14161 [Tropilaelaps mercedesae]